MRNASIFGGQITFRAVDVEKQDEFASISALAICLKFQLIAFFCHQSFAVC